MAANRSSIEAGKGHVTLGTDDSALTKGLDAAKVKFQSWGKAIGAIGLGIAAAGALVTAPFLYGLGVFKDMGSSIASAARVSGIGLEDLQTLSHALKVDFDQLTTASKKMDQFIAHAAAGTPEAVHRLEEMGVTLEELSRLSEGDRLRTLGAALERTYTDISQRHAAAQAIFGRGGLQLNFGGNVGAREQRLGQLGGVMSPADVALAKEYALAQKEMGIAVQGLWARIGATAAPVMREFYQMVTTIVVGVQGLVDANRPLLEIIFRVADAMVTVGAIVGFLGAGIYAVSYAFSFLSGAVGIVGSLLGSILTPVIALVSFALSALWGITTFAAGGFGVLSVASLAWGTASAIASGIAAAAMWAWSGAVAVGSAIATAWLWLYNAALWAINAGFFIVNFATWAYNAAIVALAAGTLIAKVATWLYTLAMGSAATATTVASFGVNILAAALAALALIAIPLVVGALAALFAGPLIAIGYLVYKILDMIGAFTWMANTASTVADGVIGSANRMGTALTEAWTSATAGFSRMCSGIAGDSVTAWNAIRNAFSAGNFELMWEIATTYAQLAWLEISRFAQVAWINLKFSTFTVINEVCDWLEDAFEGAWTTVSIGIARVLDWLEANWSSLLSIIWHTTSDIFTSIEDVIVNAFRQAIIASEQLWVTSLTWLANQMARIMGIPLQIILAPPTAPPQQPVLNQPILNQPGNRAADLQREADAAQARRDAQRAARNQAEAALRRAELRDANNQPEIDRLRAELDRLDTEAFVRRWIEADFRNRQEEEAPGGGEGDIITAGKGPSIGGSFFADAFRGLGGASKENPVIESNRLLTDIRTTLLPALIAEMRRLQALGWA